LSDLISLSRRPALRQFVKFIIIGFSSALIDVGISTFLIYQLHFNLNVAKTISFTVAVTNGFTWNSLWTFRGMGSGRRHEQYVKFFLVNIVGYVLNLAITNLGLFALTGHFMTREKPALPLFLAATCSAIICVSLWNFTANKLWTFRHTPVPAV
jgi:putative flippase GtrA